MPKLQSISTQSAYDKGFHHMQVRLGQFLLIITLLISSVSSCTTPQSSTEASDFQKGITFVSWQSGEYSLPTAELSLTNLSATGANWVAVIVTVYQETATTTEIFSTDQTPTDQDLVHVISKAHELGLRVLLKPHIDILSGDWRGEIGFSTEEDWNAWFDSYIELMNHYAELAEQNHVEAISVGTELATTSGRADDWRRVVTAVDERFSGKLTYASNFDEADSIEWWNAVDYIGVDAYFPLPTSSEDPSVQDLKAAWEDQGHVAILEGLSKEYERPVLLTEIGYRSVRGANNTPWVWQEAADVDLILQANLYQAALETFLDKEWCAGMYFWNWSPIPIAGGEKDTDYTPQNKPAEDVLKAYYGNGEK